jgi:hypothetical protein
MRIYISGAITGLPAGNRPAFTAAALQLAGLGHAVINPHEIGDIVRKGLHPKDPTWSDYMRTDIVAMMGCDAVALLEGWDLSRGAKVEYDLAFHLCMPCMPLAAWIEQGAAS